MYQTEKIFDETKFAFVQIVQASLEKVLLVNVRNQLRRYVLIGTINFVLQNINKELNLKLEHTRRQTNLAIVQINVPELDQRRGYERIVEKVDWSP